MRKSRAITLTVLAGLTLTGCSLASGCDQSNTPTPPATPAPQYEPPDHTWYDEDGNPIPEEWKTDDQGNRVPAHGVPHDRYGRPWVYTSGIWAPHPVLIGHSYGPSRSSSWLTGGSGYRTSNTTTTYRAGSGTGSSSVVSSHTSSAPSGSSISRGGFGSTGSSSGSSSS